MDSNGRPERAGSLVIELAARTVIVDGRRVELPPTEFSILAVLAARPGEVVAHKELLEEAFGDNAYMDAQDLHWRIWNIRKLIGDADKTIIRNRRGVGFVLESRRVEVLEGVAEAASEPTHVIRLEPEDHETPQVAPSLEVPAEEEQETRRPAWFVVSPTALVVIALLAGLVLGGSWLAGYSLSQKRGAPTAAVAPPPSSTTADQDPKDDGQATKEDHKRPKKKGKKPPSGNSSNVAAGPIGSVPSGGAPSDNQAGGPSDDSQDETDDGGATHEQPPPPPQPNAQLFHLYNADSGDHIMTTSSSVANQKQAAGYDATLEGGVFTTKEKGTVAIGLDSGTAFVYRDASSAPDDVSIVALYRLTLGNDSFYTTSSSAANQAQAQGWSRSTAGYVAS